MPAPSRPPILAIGTVAFDTIETPFARAERVVGGSATYLTLAARLLTEPVRLVAVVGADFPAEEIEALRARGVDTEGLTVDPDGATFFWAGRYRYDLNERDTLQTDLNVLATFDPTLPEAYRDSRIVCLGNLDPTIQAHVLDQLPDADLVVCDTMNFWIERTPDALRATLARVDVLAVNDAEARQLADEPNLVRAARTIRAMGPKTLIIKKGEHGALLFTGDVEHPTVFAVPAYPLEDIEDPTGAGDTFMGGFVGHLARVGRYGAEEMRQAVVVGSALASFVVEAFGTDRLRDLTPADLEARVAAFHDLTAFPSALVTL